MSTHGQNYRLKARREDCFAAGEEFRRALQTLGAGAFRLYAWVCLHAERASGRMSFERAALARRLGTSRSTLRRQLRELVRAGVCRLERSPNQHCGSVLHVEREFWPYVPAEPAGTAEGACARTPPAAGPQPGPRPSARRSAGPRTDGGQPEEAAYLAAVREALLRPSCVQAVFSPEDEATAREWHRAGVPLAEVERAILLGSVRKSISMANRKAGQPVRSLRYFESSLQEVLDGDWPEGYWEHVRAHLRRCEANWPDEAQLTSRRRLRKAPEETPGGFK